jgi:hypothetical protein
MGKGDLMENLWGVLSTSRGGGSRNGGDYESYKTYPTKASAIQAAAEFALSNRGVRFFVFQVTDEVTVEVPAIVTPLVEAVQG